MNLKSIDGRCTDRYELTMAAAYWRDGRAAEPAVFDSFFRTAAFQGGDAVFAGLETLLDALQSFRYEAPQLEYLGQSGFHDEFLAYLSAFSFRGTIWSVPEGEVVFPLEPVLRVEGGLIETQIIETLLLNVLNQLIPRYPLVAATQDWHPPGHLSFASSHAGRQPFETIELDGVPQTLWPDHCQWDSPGAQFAPALCMSRAVAIFGKGMDHRVDSHSGFFDNQRRHRTGLDAWLRAMNVDEVHLAGLAAEICVAYTARDAVALGFRSVIVRDGTRALSNQGFDQSAAVLKPLGIAIVSSEQALAR
jgi:nicotinamidase/pyrazinamidase